MVLPPRMPILICNMRVPSYIWSTCKFSKSKIFLLNVRFRIRMFLLVYHAYDEYPRHAPFCRIKQTCYDCLPTVLQIIMRVEVVLKLLLYYCRARESHTSWSSLPLYCTVCLYDMILIVQHSLSAAILWPIGTKINI